MNKALPLEIRGFARSSVDALHPLPERPEESLPLSYCQTVLGAISNYYTPNISGHSSPTTDNAASVNHGLSESNTWSSNTGNLTGRSSVYSWENEDEFDRQASATVKRMFDEIDEMLFEGKPFNGSTQLFSECEEWSQRFPHLRLQAHLVPAIVAVAVNDDGTQLIPLPPEDPRVYNYRPQTSVLEDVEEFGAFDSQGLFIRGVQIDPSPDLSESYVTDAFDEDFAELQEEVLAEDGEMEEYFAYDQPAVEEESNDRSKFHKYRRHRRLGYPPVTPNACAKDTVVSQLFDQIWGEVVLWLRDLIRLYCEKVLRDKRPFFPDAMASSDRMIESPLRPNSQSVLSRISHFPSQLRLRTPSSLLNAPLDTKGLKSAIRIKSLSLNERTSSAAASHLFESREDTPCAQARPVSSRTVTSRFSQFGTHASDYASLRMPSVKSKRNLRSIRLSHLDNSRPRTPTSQDDVIGEIDVVRGKRLFTGNERSSSPPPANSFSPQPWGRNGVLPPLSVTYADTPVPHTTGRTSAKNKVYFDLRTSSAATNDSRQSLRERTRNYADSRPNTTHSYRTETPNLSGRRLSTPMGNHLSQLALHSRGNSRLGLGLGLTGVSMQINSNHPAAEVPTSSHNQYGDGRGTSPESDIEPEGFFSHGPSIHPSHKKGKLTSFIR